MTNIDKQRVAAVRKLEALGYNYQGGEWVPASAPLAAAGPRSLMTAECDAMHGVLVQRADALEVARKAQTRRPNSRPSLMQSMLMRLCGDPLGKVNGGKG